MSKNTFNQPTAEGQSKYFWPHEWKTGAAVAKNSSVPNVCLDLVLDKNSTSCRRAPCYTPPQLINYVLGLHIHRAVQTGHVPVTAMRTYPVVYDHVSFPLS